MKVISPPPPPDISPPLVFLVFLTFISLVQTLRYFKRKIRKDFGTITERIKCRKPRRREITLKFLTMRAKMNSELPVCYVSDTFTLLNFDFVPKIEMHSTYNEA